MFRGFGLNVLFKIMCMLENVMNQREVICRIFFKDDLFFRYFRLIIFLEFQKKIIYLKNNEEK